MLLIIFIHIRYEFYGNFLKVCITTCDTLLLYCFSYQQILYLYFKRFILIIKYKFFYLLIVKIKNYHIIIFNYINKTLYFIFFAFNFIFPNALVVEKLKLLIFQ